MSERLSGQASCGGVVDIGGVQIELEGDAGPAADLVERVLAEVGAAPNDRFVPLGRVHVTGHRLAALDRSRGLGGVEVAGDLLQWRFDRSGMVVRTRTGRSEGPFEAWVSVEARPMPFKMPRRAFRWVEPTFFQPAEAQAYFFIPSVLEALILLHGRSHAPLHAATIERDGGALALTSAGGVGKTSTSMAYLGSGRARFLSDDITMLAADGGVSPYGRLPMVYDYNLATNPTLSPSVRSHGGRAGRLQWAITRPLHGSKRRRRIAPEELYGRPVMGRRTSLSAVAFLVRSSRGAVATRELSPDELVRRSLAILAEEFASIIHVLRLAEATGHPNIVEPMLDRAGATLAAAFGSCEDLFEVQVPRQLVSVDALVDAIESRLAR